MYSHNIKNLLQSYNMDECLISETLKSLQTFLSGGCPSEALVPQQKVLTIAEATWPPSEQRYSLIQLAFSNPMYYIGSFLNRVEIDQLAAVVCEGEDATPEAAALVATILAIGVYAGLKSNMGDIPSSCTASGLLETAVSLFRLFHSNYTILSLKVTCFELYISRTWFANTGLLTRQLQPWYVCSSSFLSGCIEATNVISGCGLHSV